MSAFSTPSNGIHQPDSIAAHMKPPRVEMTPKKLDGRSFGDVYQQTLDQQRELKFSQTALNRMKMMGLELNQDDLEKLKKAVDTMIEKGGKESLVMMDGTAFVLDTNSRTVLNVVNDERNSAGAFTKIDSAMVVDSRAIL